MNELLIISACISTDDAKCQIAPDGMYVAGALITRDVTGAHAQLM